MDEVEERGAEQFVHRVAERARERVVDPLEEGVESGDAEQVDREREEAIPILFHPPALGDLVQQFAVGAGEFAGAALHRVRDQGGASGDHEQDGPQDSREHRARRHRAPRQGELVGDEVGEGQGENPDRPPREGTIPVSVHGIFTVSGRFDRKRSGLPTS